MNEMLFYGGLIGGLFSLVALIIFFIVAAIGKIKLQAKFDAEYGRKIKK